MLSIPCSKYVHYNTTTYNIDLLSECLVGLQEVTCTQLELTHLEVGLTLEVVGGHHIHRDVIIANLDLFLVVDDLLQHLEGLEVAIRVQLQQHVQLGEVKVGIDVLLLQLALAHLQHAVEDQHGILRFA